MQKKSRDERNQRDLENQKMAHRTLEGRKEGRELLFRENGLI